MYKKVVVMLSMIALSWANIRVNFNPDKYYNRPEPNKKAEIEMTTSPTKAITLMELYTDSAANQYGMWSQYQNPVNILGDTILFVNRALSDSLSGSGFITAAWSVDGGITWSVARDINVIAGVADQGGRYPSALPTPLGPVATFPELTGGNWGYMVALTGIYDDPSTWYGENGGNQGVHKNVSVYVPELNAAFCVGASASGGLLYGIYDITNGYYTTSPTAVSDIADLMGLDYAAGFVHMIGLGNNFELLDVKYDVNNATFAVDTLSQSIPGYILPSGDTLNSIGWYDAAVLSDGTPIIAVGLVTDTIGKPILKQYESRAIVIIRPDTTFLAYVDTTSDGSGFVYYTQLSVDKTNNAVLLAYEKMTTLIDSAYTDTIPWGIYDIVGKVSTDGGYTWSDEINFTNTPDISEQMFQLARSFKFTASDTMAAVFVYATPRGTSDQNYDLMYDVAAVNGATSVYYHLVSTGVLAAVSERRIGITKTFTLTSNVVKNALTINANREITGNLKVVDPTGRVVKNIPVKLKSGRNTISLNGIQSGVYFINLNSQVERILIEK